jgi:hypothetical protein
MNKKLFLASSILSTFFISISHAQVPADSAYKKDPQTRFSRDFLNDTFATPNFINCYLNKTGIREMVGRGKYQALVDGGKCETEATGSSSNGDVTVPVYEAAMVESYIENNSLKAKLWINFNDQGTAYKTFVSASIDESDSIKPPYGKWRVDYCDSTSTVACAYLGFAEVDGKNVIVLDKSTNSSRRGTAVIGSATNSNGYGRFENTDGTSNITATFRSGELAYRAKINQNGSNSDMCYSPNINDPGTKFAMWDTNLYNPTTGSKIDRFAGFRIKRAESSNYEGYASYWGVHWWHQSNINNSQVTRVIGEKGPNGETQETIYDFFEIPGKLKKFTVTRKTLDEINGIQFLAGSSSPDLQTISPSSDRPPVSTHVDLIMRWNSQTEKFVISGWTYWANSQENSKFFEDLKSYSIEDMVNQLNITELNGRLSGVDTRISIPLKRWINNQFQTLTKSEVSVSEHNSSLVKPGQVQSGNLFCSSQCHGLLPRDPSTVGQAKNSIYYWDSSTASLKVATSNGAVVTTDSGSQTGKLLSLSASMDQLACDTSVSPVPSNASICSWKDVDEWYQWESGPDSWNKQQYLKAVGTDNYVNFLPPLQLTYLVPDLPVNGEYRGRRVSVQYPGAGQLWVPGKCVDRVNLTDASCSSETGWINEFVIPTTESQSGKVQEQSSNNEYLVKWLSLGVYFAPLSGSAEAQCKSDLSDWSVVESLELPVESQFMNPSSPSSPNYIGPWVDLTGSPAVIDGKLQ